MTTPTGRHPLAALRRAASRTLSERRLPPYLGEYALGRARVAAAGVHRAIEPILWAPGRARAARRNRALLAAGPERRLVRAGSAWRVAVPFEHEAVASLAAEHRRLVLDALSEAGVTARTAGDAVTVAPEDRTVALAALRSVVEGSCDPVYVEAGGVADLVVSLDGAGAARLAAARVWSVYRYHWLSSRLVVGEDQACRITFGGGPTTASQPRDGVTIDFPIDVVYTWVDDTDPVWRSAYEQALRSARPETTNVLAANASRYRNRDEIRYSLRSLTLHAPWVGKVFLVTSGHVPEWLDTSDERIRVVRHDEILDAACLPTFNSHAIESALHRVPDLTEHYLYCNDDFFFGRPVPPSLFFLPDGTPCCFPDDRAPIPDGPADRNDAPVDAAAKNVRDLVEARLGVRPVSKMLHAPYAQRKSVLAEIEREFAADLARTAASRFRAVDDLSVASCLSHHYGVATGSAVIGSLTSEYVNVADRWAPIKMQRLLARRECDVFCLNETDVPPRQERRVQKAVARFLVDYFPRTCPLEIKSLSSEAARARGGVA